MEETKITSSKKRYTEHAAHHPAALQYLRELVAMPTVSNDTDATSDAIDYIAAHLKGKMHVTRYIWDGNPALVATTQYTKTPTVLLVAHIDVVPSHDGHFALTQEEDKLYGRGVYDMKFAIAAYLHLVDSLGDTLADYNFGIMVTSDEEIGSANGTAKLIAEGWQPAMCIVPDGGYDWELETFAKGMVRVALETHGKTAHGSRPWEGENAASKMIKLLHELEQEFPNQGPDTSTINIGILESGQAINKIPHEASVHIDFRTIDNASAQRIQALVERLATKYGAEIKMLEIHPACHNDLTNPYLAHFAKLITTITGNTVQGSTSYGASDARFFSPLGIPCAITMPVGGNHHREDEWLSYTAFVQFQEILRRFIDWAARV